VQVRAAVSGWNLGWAGLGWAGLVSSCVEETGWCRPLTPHPTRSTHPANLTHPLPTPQADFASSAVDFLHRVGRTARAGKGGRVTSLYLPDVEALVGAIQDNVAAGGRSGGREGWVGLHTCCQRCSGPPLSSAAGA
jgi:hypothetical protein